MRTRERKREREREREGQDSKHFENTLAMFSVVSLPQIRALDCILTGVKTQSVPNSAARPLEGVQPTASCLCV